MLNIVSLNRGIFVKLLMTLFLSSLILLAGCQVVGVVKVKPTKVKVPVVIVKVPAIIVIEGQQKHCPPGQAKKGNC